MLRKNWFLISLLCLLPLGYALALPLRWLADANWLKWGIVMLTMFLMAWPVSFEQMKSTVLRPGPAIAASLLNVGLIPILIWPLAAWAGPELGPGLLIAAATPSTLASAAVWTRRALGNDGIAIMVTVITNATCFLVMPAWIYVQTGDQLDQAQLTGTISKLLFFVVLPIGIGQLARTPSNWADWATAQKSTLSALAMVGLLSIVFLGAIQMGLRFAGQPAAGLAVDESVGLAEALSFRYLVITALLVIGVHVLVFWIGLKLGAWLGFGRPEQIAMAFSGSQKTLMVGLSTAISLGFSMIPIVMFHAFQLLIDTLFAERLRSQQLAQSDTDRTVSS